MNTRTMKQNLNDAVRVATIDLRGDGAAVIDWHDVAGFVVWFDGGVWPDGDEHKTFTELSSALTAVAQVIAELEADGGVWFEE